MQPQETVGGDNSNKLPQDKITEPGRALFPFWAEQPSQGPRIIIDIRKLGQSLTRRFTIFQIILGWAPPNWPRALRCASALHFVYLSSVRNKIICRLVICRYANFHSKSFGVLNTTYQLAAQELNYIMYIKFCRNKLLTAQGHEKLWLEVS